MSDCACARLQDETAIRALVAAYADATNCRSPEGMAAVLAPDGIIEKPGFGDPVRGRENILKRYRRLQRERDFLCQMVLNSVVHVDGDRGTVRSWIAETKQVADSGAWLAMIGVYQDEAVRLPEGWRFSRRVQTTVMEYSLPDDAVTKHALPAFFDIAELPTL